MRIVDDDLISDLFVKAKISERKRAHLLLHGSHKDKVQRLLIGMCEGSFVEPHYHELSHQWEMFTVLNGIVRFELYSETGELLQSLLLGTGQESSIVEVAPGEIHSVMCLSSRALLMEVKEGPFDERFAKAMVDFDQGKEFV